MSTTVPSPHWPLSPSAAAPERIPPTLAPEPGFRARWAFLPPPEMRLCGGRWQHRTCVHYRCA
eukprot:scaffold18214_cov45-Isochrysis_galbana.AAC.1